MSSNRSVVVVGGGRAGMTVAHAPATEGESVTPTYRQKVPRAGAATFAIVAMIAMLVCVTGCSSAPDAPAESKAVTPPAGGNALDCNRDGKSDDADVRAALRVAIGVRPMDACPALDADKDGKLSTEERLAAAPNDVMRRYWHAALEWNDKPPETIEGAFGTQLVELLVADGFPGPGNVLMRNAVITARYATWYKKRPDAFKWAGCAAFVSKKIAMGLMPYKLESAERILFERKLLEEDPPRLLTLDLLRVTNTAVYHDLAWAHLAYLDGGLRAVEEGLGGVPDHELMLQGFRDIDAGLHIDGDERSGQALVWRGNESLLRHEQSGIIQDELGQMGNVSARILSWIIAIDFHGGSVPEEQSLAMFVRSMERQGRHNPSIASFDDRWLWIEDEILPIWRRLDEQDQPALLKRAQKLIELQWSVPNLTD